MGISPVASKLIQAIDAYKAESNKVDYITTDEEYLKLQREIAILQKHIELVNAYEKKNSD